MSEVLRSRSADPTPLIDALHALTGEAADPRRDFQLGVAYRMRYDSPHAEEGDFAAAIEAWQRALRARPDQYIWRRRLQQYGPLTDKPYPFYGWIREAQAVLEARGEAPEVLDAALTLSERSLSVVEGDARPLDASPDPKGSLPRDEEDALRIEAALVFDTRRQSGTGRLHVEVHVRDAEASAWHGGTDPVVVWVEAPVGGSVTPPGLARSLPEEARQEALRFEFDVAVPDVAAGEAERPEQALEGYVLAPLCRAADGTCLYVRKAWKVRLRPRGGRR